MPSLHTNTDARSLYLLEDWRPSTSAKGATRFLAIMDEFQMRIVTGAKRVATRNGEKEAITPNFKKKIKETFVDTLCFLFDGILNVAISSREETPRRPSRIILSRVSPGKDVVSFSLLRPVCVDTYLLPGLWFS